VSVLVAREVDAVRVIEVFADVWCPFTHVGLRRLVERRDVLGRHDVWLHVRAWPLELVNGTALDADFVAEEVAELQAQVAPELFGGFDPATFPSSSLPALALAARSYRSGADQGERVSLALRHALFEEGRDIGDEDVLQAIATANRVDLPRPRDDSAVRTDWKEGVRRHVIGSPHFFVDGRGFFCPSLDISRVDGRLRIAVDRPALTAFLDRCFAPN
jgi:predicted DsbA family dithiol-disulfide isomerase